MTYKPQSMPGKQDSVIKHEKFEDLMNRYWGQMESALYALEQACINETVSVGCDRSCISKITPHKAGGPHCKLGMIREIIGDHVQQHDIQIPEDNTQAQRKANR